ncbi:MAG TPA: S9 family peptidase [Flavilitoribacter sp.]|nr:S9 family peptidase [Flavilitoribacter sp.]HMQ86001.1 S9 family peptidase [Flavilitoribacter sp.]
MKNRILLLLAVMAWSFSALSQKNITLEDIWRDYTFYPNAVPGFNFMNDGRHYTQIERNRIQQYDLTTGAFVQTLFDAAAVSNPEFSGSFDDYAFSDDENKLLIKSETEAIYRHSTRAKFFIYDRESREMSPVFPTGKVMYATFNPGADKVAFVYQNNLFYKDLNSGITRQITTDGEQNAIINGATDWVYEEEFSFDVAFQWSPDGKRLAFYRFDEREVPEMTLTHFRNELYPEYETFKYPKVGEKNSKVTIFIYDITAGNSVKVNTWKDEDHYIPRIKWTQDPEKLCVFRMNRHQNELELLLADATSGATNLLLRETNKYYIDIHDNLRFLADGKHFLWTSEGDGWNHLYLYNMDGKLVRQLTKGEWELTDFYGVDEKKQVVYYQAAEKTPLERQIYSLGLDGKNKKTLIGQSGWNSAQFSSTFDYFVLTHSTANQAPSYAVYNREGKAIRTIEDNADIAVLQKTYGTNPVEFFKFKTGEGVELNGWMLKPADFDPGKKYPVFMTLYGGPGSQMVTDSWKGQDYWWYEMLTQQGFIVACVDNRGTGARGEAFKKMTYLQLGKYETIDQIEAAKYLGSLPYTDPARIGIFGWSYGGFMSTSCLLKGNDVFKAAIAVAPVTSWRWYDTIYTERYMRTEEENPEGYRDNSPVNFADRLKGDYLLVHGLGDDNVHFQNTAEMTNALIDANKQYDTFFYPNRNHGIYGGNTRLHLYRKMTNFLDEKLNAPGMEKPRP